MVAYLSHVPQIVSWALEAAARRDAVARRHLALAGPGFARHDPPGPQPAWPCGARCSPRTRAEVARARAALRARAAARRGPLMDRAEQDAIAFVLKLARGLHAHGYPAHRLEAALERVSRRLGLHGQFFSMPTALFASFGEGGEQRTFQIRVEPGAMDLRTLVRPGATWRTQVADGAHRSGRGRAADRRGLGARPAPYPPG